MVVSVACPSSKLGTATEPEPFGVNDIFPLVSVELIVLPSTLMLSTCIAPVLIFKAEASPLPSSTVRSVPSTPSLLLATCKTLP